MSLAAQEQVDLGVTALLAALEMLAARRGRPLPTQPAWASRLLAVFPRPALTARLRRFLDGETSGSSGSAGSASSVEDKLQQLENQARSALRPRSFRGVRAIEAVSRKFATEGMAPLLNRGIDAESVQELAELRRRYGLICGGLERYVDDLGAGFLHPPEGQLRQVLLRACREMAAAVDAYIKERERTGGSLAAPRPDSRRALMRELEELERSGWAGREGARLFRLLFVEGPLPSFELPGDRPVVPGTLFWSFPRCARLWQAGELQLGEYSLALDEHLRGDGPIAYALKQADEGGRSAWRKRSFATSPTA